MRSRPPVGLGPGSLVGVRLTEFHERVTLRFGATYGASVLSDHVLTDFDGSLAHEFRDFPTGRIVLRQRLCVDFDIPREQW